MLFRSISKDWDINNDEQNIKAGNAILSDLYGKHKGAHDKVLAEYYGGPGAMDEKGNIRTDVGPREGVPGPNIGGYIDQVTKRIEATPIVRTIPTTIAEKKRAFDIETEATKQDIASDIKERDEWKKSTELKELASNRAINARTIDLVKSNPNITGILAEIGKAHV